MAKDISIWIDADSCPTLVRNHVVKMGNRLNCKVYFVANKDIPCNQDGQFQMIICKEEKDSADNYIFDHVAANDLVITRDIVFAQRLIEKNICTINDRGRIFDKNNIKELLSTRDFDLQLANIGLVKHYNEGYDKKKFAAFANSFDKVIHNLLK